MKHKPLRGQRVTTHKAKKVVKKMVKKPSGKRKTIRHSRNN